MFLSRMRTRACQAIGGGCAVAPASLRLSKAAYTGKANIPPSADIGILVESSHHRFFVGPAHLIHRYHAPEMKNLSSTKTFFFLFSTMFKLYGCDICRQSFSTKEETMHCFNSHCYSNRTSASQNIFCYFCITCFDLE